MKLEDDELTEAEAPPAPQEGPMDETRLQALVHGILSDCQQYTDTQLSLDRAKATDYYLGKPFGNEESGRSQVVLTEVRDGVQGVLPPLLRVFFGPERVVEFTPRDESRVGQAEQATDYVQFIFAEENHGFLKSHSVLKDGLVRKLGIFKWGWAPAAPQAYRLTGLTEEQLTLLAGEPGVTITRIEPADDGTQTVELTRVDAEGSVRVWTLPPEEFLFSREARSVEEALCVAHRTELTRGELIALGIPAEEIDEHAGPGSTLLLNPEETARRDVLTQGAARDPEAGEANDKIEYIEAYVRLDYDGDGVAELRKICTIGTGHYVVVNEPVDAAPFSIFCPDPEPHTMLGQSWADRLMDMQLLKSNVMRSTLDSLAAAIFPRTAYVEGQVNVLDILNTEIGAPIRTRAPGMVQPFTHPFVGKEAFPVLTYLDDMIEQRTGRNKGAMGLDADALQSSTKAAVGAAVSAAQAQAEMLARIFAEQALKPMFRGILKLLVLHQPRARMVRLRNRWVEVDPRAWDADMDVTVNVALGTGLVEEKVQALLGIAAKQEQILATLGPQNPLVTVAQYRNTLARIAELLGFKDTTSFFQIVPPDWQPPPSAGQEQPSPEQVLAEAQLQIEQIKTERELAIKQAELQLKQQMATWEHERATAQAAADHELRRYELELKYNAQISQAQFQADVERERMAQEQHLTLHERAHDAVQADADRAHQQEMAAQQAAQQAASETMG